MSASKAAGIDNTFRRKWDREEYEERAREREREEEEEELDQRRPRSKEPPVERQPLRKRDYEVDLTSRLGKTQVVTPGPRGGSAGYYCNVCDCVLKDSANYLDHINGKKHQRQLGMSMRVERSSLSQVQQRFEAAKRKREMEYSMEVFEARVKQLEADEEEEKRLKRELKRERKREKDKDDTEDHGLDPELAGMMGFGGFNSSKKS